MSDDDTDRLSPDRAPLSGVPNPNRRNPNPGAYDPASRWANVPTPDPSNGEGAETRPVPRYERRRNGGI